MSYRKIDTNKYKIEVETTVKGKRRRKSKTVTTKLKGKDLEYFISDIEKELYNIINDDVKYDFAGYTFEEFARYVIDSSKVTQRTIDSYNQYLRNRTADFFTGMKLVDIKTYHLQEFIDYLEKEISPKTGKPLSSKTIYHYRNLLRLIFNKAKTMDIIRNNPMAGVDMPKMDNSLKRDYYTVEEVEEFIGYLEKFGDIRYLAFFALQVYTGARPSEMYGLKWDKLDLDKGIITIDSALVKTTEGYVFKETKTNDVRTMQLSPYLISKLSDLKLYEGTKHTDFSGKFVFTNPEGNHMHESSFSKYLRKFSKKYNLKYVTPYGLRHTTGTLLVAEGVPMVNVAKILGHSSTNTTSKYVHPLDSVNDKAMDILTDVTTPKLRLVK